MKEDFFLLLMISKHWTGTFFRVPVAHDAPIMKKALLGDGVPQEAMSTTCICMDTQNGKLLTTS